MNNYKKITMKLFNSPGNINLQAVWKVSFHASVKGICIWNCLTFRRAVECKRKSACNEVLTDRGRNSASKGGLRWQSAGTTKQKTRIIFSELHFPLRTAFDRNILHLKINWGKPLTYSNTYIYNLLASNCCPDWQDSSLN